MTEQAPNIDLSGGGGRLVYDKERRTIVTEEVYLSAVKGRQDMRSALREAREKLATARNDALEEAAAYHDKAAADCEAIAAVNQHNEMGSDCMTHAADHRVAADDIRAMKTA